MSDHEDADKVLDAAKAHGLETVFVLGEDKEGNLFVAGSGDESKALTYCADFLKALAKGKFA